MDKEKLGELIMTSQESMYRVAKSLLRSDADCADAIQEAVVKAFASLHTLKNERYAKTWLTRILINECYAIMRQRKRLVPLEDISEQADSAAPDYSPLYRAVSELPEDMRLAVTLCYAEGYSIREIAQIEHTTESAIKNRLLRARARLREALEEEDI
ncbi:MAG: sigma-70 family RNA polymerase sigma factor [Ruminococcaceae bacterium]|nr:sigma-70 family RNA polymerase sigma factor [Oscillospiraceae bacterium]